jgi:hypothetical protein
LCHLREHAGLQNTRGAPRPVAAGSSAPHPGCLQRRGRSAAGGSARPAGPGSGIWPFIWSVMSVIWSVMSGPFFFFHVDKKRNEKKTGN